MKKVAQADIVRTALECLGTALDCDREDRDNAIDDLRFENGEQWTAAARAMRRNRPCLTINQIPQMVDQVVGEQRANRPEISVVPIDGETDVETAKVITGLIGNIKNQSQANSIIDHAYEHAVICGYGAWRIVTDYIDDTTNEQEIKLQRVDNPLSVVWDPSAVLPTREDARWCIIFSNMPTEDFEERYPNNSTESIPGVENSSTWKVADTVVVAEYFVKEDTPGVLYEYLDGECTEEERIGEDYLRKRTISKTKVVWYKISGSEILEGPTEIPSKYIPIVPLWGKERNVNGKTSKRGLIRFAKDPARLYNYSRSNEAERIALSVKQPYMVTATQIKDHIGQWNRADDDQVPYMLYTPDARVPGGKPVREHGPEVPVADMQQSQIAAGEIKITTGIFSARLGESSNEISGEAIKQRRSGSQVTTYAFIDNLLRAMMYSDRVLIDMLPRVYDTARVVRIIGDKQIDKFIKINQEFMDNETGEATLYDLSTGKYDVVAKPGPSYATQREEARDGMLRLLETLPNMPPPVVAEFIRTQDWPNATDIADMIAPVSGEGEPGDQEKMAQMMEQAKQQVMQEQEVQQGQLELEKEQIKLQIEQQKLLQSQVETQATEAGAKEQVAGMLQELGLAT